MDWPQYLILFNILFVRIPIGVYRYATKPNLSGAELVGSIFGYIMYYMIFLWVLYMGGFFN